MQHTGASRDEGVGEAGAVGGEGDVSCVNGGRVIIETGARLAYQLLIRDASRYTTCYFLAPN